MPVEAKNPTYLKILEWLAAGDHINVYRKPTRFRTAKGGVFLVERDIRILRRRKYIAEYRAGSLDITEAGKEIISYYRLGKVRG